MDNFEEMLELAKSDARMAERVAIMYARGDGVEKNPRLALQYFYQAAKGGSAVGCYQMGRAYELGQGVKKNLDTARRYYETAAAKGYIRAQQALERLTEEEDFDGTYLDEPEPAPRSPQRKEQGRPQGRPMSGKPGAGVYRAPEAACSVELEKPRNKEKSRMTAVLLAFFLGALGAHSFYIGNYKKGALQLLVSLVSMPLLGIPLGMVWGWVDMVRILSGKLDINVSEHKKDTKKEIPQEEAVTYQLSSADYAYRRQHGVIPQLDFMNDKDPLSRVAAPDVVFSPFASLNGLNKKELVKGAAGIGAIIAKIAIAIGGGLSLPESIVVGGGNNGSGENHFSNLVRDRALDEALVKNIKKEEADAWPCLYLTRSFQPAEGALGDTVYREGSGGQYHTGNGYRIFKNGDYFEGYFENGKPRIGMYIWSNGQRYLGGFDANMRSAGNGLILYPDGTYYYGELSNDNYQGYGYRLYRDSVYYGFFDRGKRVDGSMKTIEGTGFIGKFDEDEHPVV